MQAGHLNTQQAVLPTCSYIIKTFREMMANPKHVQLLVTTAHVREDNVIPTRQK
jgi:hypothetical protein